MNGVKNKTARVMAQSVLMPSGCREWTGAYSAQGYGKVSWNGKYILVHRWMWRKFRGPLTRGLVISHLCNNRRCHEVTHLSLGTQADNIAHAVKCGRMRMGEMHYATKLIDTDVRIMRLVDRLVPRSKQGRRRNGVMPTLGVLFGIHEGTAKRILNHVTWKSVA